MATGTPNYAINPNVGVAGTPAIVSIGDVSRTSPTQYATVFTAGSSGSRIERLIFTAQGPTVGSVVRLFLYDGSTYHLYSEVAVPELAYTAGAAAWTATLEAVSTPDLFPILLKTGWSLCASINDTQIAQEGSPNSIAASQTLGAAGYLNLNGSFSTDGVNNAIVTASAPTSGTPIALTTTPYVLPVPAQVTLTSSSNLSALSFMIFGRDPTGAAISETIAAGPNNSTVYSAKVYASVSAFLPLGTSVSTLTVGYSAVTTPPLTNNALMARLFSGGNLSGINFTITGSNDNGTVLSETLAGPNGGYVLSTNLYTNIYSVKASAAVSSSVSVGNVTALSGVSINAIGGDF